MKRTGLKIFSAAMAVAMTVSSATSVLASTTASPKPNTLPITTKNEKLIYAGKESNNPEYSLADNREVWKEIEKKTGVKLDFQILPDADYNQSMKVRLAAQDVPDIFFVPSGVNAISLFKDGTVADMNKLVRENAPNIMKLINDNDEVRAAMVAADGRIYAATVTTAGDMTVNPRTMFYRRDWQKKLNIPDPVTIEDYYNMFVAFMTKDPNGNGQQDEIPLFLQNLGNVDILGSAFDVMHFGWNNGWSFDDKGVVRYDYVRPEFKNYLEFLNKMYVAGIIPKEVYYKSGQDTAMIASNRLGAYTNGIGACETRNGQLITGKYINDISEGYYWLKPPVNKVTGKRELANKPLVTNGNGYCIGKKSKYQEIAVRWIDYVWGSKEGQMLMELGIEGKTYDIKDGKIMMTKFATNNPDGLGVQQVLRTLGSIPPDISRQTNETFYATWTYSPFLIGIMDYAKPFYTRPAFPAFLGSVELSAEFTRVSVDVNTYRDEMVQKFIMGQTPLADFDKYVDQMNKLGAKRLIQIQQTQYDAMKKNK